MQRYSCTSMCNQMSKIICLIYKVVMFFCIIVAVANFSVSTGLLTASHHKSTVIEEHP